MRRGLILLLCVLPPLAGCVATAGPARESVIENVAPLPRGSPGVSLYWGPDSDPLALAPGGCATIPWLLRAHGLARPARVDLDLSASPEVQGRLVGSLTPANATLAGDDAANGTALVCATQDAPRTEGRLSIFATAADETIAVSGVGVEIRP